MRMKFALFLKISTKNERKFYYALDGQSSTRIFEFMNQECNFQINN